MLLVRYALQSQQAEASQTYVALTNDEVVGFYTLVVAQVEYDDAPSRLAKGLAKHPIPVMLLARLAIATSWQGKRLGAGLLKDAMLSTLQAAQIAGIRAMVVHAKDEAAKAFYERFDFIPSPSDPDHLFLLFEGYSRCSRLANLSIIRSVVSGHRLQNVSRTAAESRGLGWTAVNETKRHNRL